MKRLFETILVLLASLHVYGAVAIPKEIRSYDSVADLVAAQTVNVYPLVHVKGYYAPGDGGGGFFVPTNTVASTNYGSRINSGVASWSWEAQFENDEINVLRFGAKGDGTTVDTARIQAAATAAAGGRILHFPRTSAKFKVDGTITILSHTTITGPGTVWQSAENTVLFTMGSVTNVTFLDLRLEGHGGDYVDASGRLARGIRVFANTTDRARNIRIDKCDFEFFAYAAVDFVSVHGFWLTDNNIEGPGSAEIAGGENYCFGISLWDDIDDGIVSGNNIKRTAQGIFGGVSFSNVSVSKNPITEIVGQHGMYFNQSIGLSIHDNPITNCFHSGIKVQLAANALGDAENISIKNNPIGVTGSHAILVDNVDPGNGYRFRNVSITGNTINGDQADAGIRVAYVTNGKVSENVIAEKWYGVYSKNCEDVVISDNITRDTYKPGIQVETPTRVFVQRNHLFNPGNEPAGSTRFGLYGSGTEGEVWWEDNFVTNSTAAQMQYAMILHASWTGVNQRIIKNKLYGATSWAGATGFKEFDIGEIETLAAVPSALTRGIRSSQFFGPSAPASGTYRVGDIVWDEAPAAGGTVGWICTTAGTPGTWKAFGSIAP